MHIQHVNIVLKETWKILNLSFNIQKKYIRFLCLKKQTLLAPYILNKCVYVCVLSACECAGMLIHMCLNYASVFIGTGACCSIVHDFEDARSGKREKREGFWWKRSWEPVNGGEECFTYTTCNLQVVLLSMNEPCIIQFYQQVLYSFQCCRPNSCPVLTIDINMSYIVDVRTLALPFDPPCWETS